MKYAELTQEGYTAWLAERPDCVQRRAAEYPPNLIYRMLSTGQTVLLLSYGTEDQDTTCDHCRVAVVHPTPDGGLQVEYEVYGVELSDLVESDWPDGPAYEVRVFGATGGC